MSKDLLKIIPKKQLDRVLNQYRCDLSPDFLGFTDIYKKLSLIIPKHWIIIDFGCSYAPQCFYFINHKKYIGIDPEARIRFYTKNTKYYLMTTKKFIEKFLSNFNQEETFAICSYVPTWYGHDSKELVRKNFKNVFVYYPHGGHPKIF